MSEHRLTPGLMVIHGNHPEALRDLLVQWMSRHPLAPLENEIILVQSNGIAQWLKLALGRDVAEGGCGVTAALDVQLPAQFLWRAYRGALGRDEIPEVSVLDKAPLTWRLMRLLPTLLEQDEFVTLQRFLADDADLRKRHQLAERLADLFDQYQVYRADWLEDWSQGLDQLRLANGTLRPLDADNRWQAALWRALLADVGPQGLATSRAGVHRRFVERLKAADAPLPALPRRVVVFGISAMPAQSVEALAVLARHAQVLLCVHNPCRHHWADIVADKDLLRHEYRRQRRRAGTPELLSDDQQHQYAQPLLAAWGKQGRDYINLLDQYDDPETYRARLGEVSNGRIDLFSEEPPRHLLGQLQDDILELRPLDETREHWPAVDTQADDSVRFHVAHSAQREVEILHDQLLARFDADPTLRPRDIIVMVPDINTYAPHIEAVFGQLPRDDRRFIPYTLADQGQRGREPLLVALEHLLRLPDSRFAVSEILDLLDVAALRQRFGLADADLPLLRRWIDGAGVRWGLDGRQRERLGLPAAAEANSWRFGLRRMLLGFAVGEGEAFQGIQPYAEIGGLDAAALGPLASLLGALELACTRLAEDAGPQEWVERLRGLLEAFFRVTGDHDELLLQQLRDLLDGWLKTCEYAGFSASLPLSVVREAWLGGLDAGGLNQRFLAGAVSFCTLMPMRAIPFQLVCLLGMNDGDYPRPQSPLDFDLMRNDYRPGDRSRREDDRYLLLEALLSARRQLYVSWVGRSIRDNSERPPSVLIGQLRDHLADGWRRADGGDLLQGLTLEHPLQPFSRAYFGEAHAAHGIDGLYTYAREWRDVHRDGDASQGDAPLPELRLEAPIGLRVLSDFLANPVNAFFIQRLKVRFGEEQLTGQDEEPFELNGLDSWLLQFELCERLRPWVEQHWQGEQLGQRLDEQVERLRREGRLPLAAFGDFTAQALVAPLYDLLARYREQLEHWSQVEEEQRELAHAHAGVELSDWLGGLRRAPDGRLGSVQLISGKLHEGRGYKWHSLVRHWVRHLALQLCGEPVSSVLVGLTGTLELPPLPREQARAELDRLIDAWREGMCRPLPVACKVAFAWLAAGDDPDRARREAAKRYDGGYNLSGEAASSAALTRVYPDFTSLDASDEFPAWAETLYGPLFQLLTRKEESA
ncbi:exodeoxyribonuclease V subunit gamma [Pseudomonas sp. ZM23]|uniref:RecBCD enzyme subunit RecC n=1 Tax=Pseudomonas triclosanedens TaxID=2961893 RepID=A0ABY7A1V0_9PSED|nr:exodeoxyribonuclease V subunit gamma [Pseudomonas triclosanedens]MCP8464678.1 exodeoxyribonuclease V subunit gamma [Pseudomonas triclosanedens]MCP8473609.1 exodeoxyribonuclease V subunit gamma [Pseudomonas triclosanedens]MCP8478446.1 exodeoxyribonuclease V subunit gamma [Pseudomonas triclosanedens]WAI50842.1 exodeoxyribonuclease V subunit gamma [Pseudomonas triclosanedens]